MRIVDKVQFTFGVFCIIAGVGLIVACILLHRTNKIACGGLPFVTGISALMRGIETTGQRKRKEELVKAQAMAHEREDKSNVGKDTESR